MDPDGARLFRAGTKVAVVTAHPDDAEFYLGGTLWKLGQAGADIHLILCTSGNRAYNPFKDHETMQRVRHGEQLAAAERYHAREVVFLNYPDGRLTASDEIIGKVADTLKRIGPEYLFIFDSEYPPRLSHRDHRTAGEIGEEASRRVGSWKWLLHFSTSAPNWAVDVTPVWNHKEELVLLHKSEFEGKRERIFGLIRGQAGGYGRLIGAALGEGLRVVGR